MLLSALPKYSDTIATTILIAACIVLFVFVVVFVSLQIYAESLYLVQVRPFFPTSVLFDAKDSKRGFEPWSSGYGKRLLFQSSWFRIQAPYTGWTFFTFICCKNCNLCLKRRK